MYIKSITLKNIKCYEDVSIEFPGSAEGQAGWHVVLGINATGKSTLLQSIALAMLGPVSGGRLLQNPSTWVRMGNKYGEIQAELTTSPNDTSVGQPRKKPYEAHVIVTGLSPVVVEGVSYTIPQVALQRPGLAKSLGSGPHSNRRGWFSAGYGPFRRLSGSGGEDEVGIQYGQGREARHLTLFRESAALTRCDKWLAQLHAQANDPALEVEQERIAGRLEDARRIIDGLLPDGVRIESITSLGVSFKTRTGAVVALSQLSDGYRSFLALAIDLLRHIIDAGEHGPIDGAGERPSIDTEGVVLIDEADAHLHPSWQREIGTRMCEAFPHIQFIVTSHSPFVAQAARPGGLFLVHAQESGQIVVESDSSVQGWRADQILLSPLFGLESTRDPATERLLARHAELLGDEATLTAELRAELAHIRGILGERLTAPGDTLAEREREHKMQQFIDARLARITKGGAL